MNLHRENAHSYRNENLPVTQPFTATNVNRMPNSTSNVTRIQPATIVNSNQSTNVVRVIADTPKPNDSVGLRLSNRSRSVSQTRAQPKSSHRNVTTIAAPKIYKKIDRSDKSIGSPNSTSDANHPSVSIRGGSPQQHYKMGNFENIPPSNFDRKKS